MGFAMTGIDVSNWKGFPNFSEVKNAGYGFMMHKLTEGHTYLDPCAHKNIQNAKAAGLHVGVYHFLRATTALSAKQEAEFFLSKVKQELPLDMPVALDVEAFSGVSASAIAAAAREWINVVSAEGMYVALYINKDYADRVFNVKGGGFKDIAIWYARYTGNAGAVHDVQELGRPAEMIQYSDSGSVPGVAGKVDVNVVRDNLPEVIVKKGLNGYNSPVLRKSVPPNAEVVSDTTQGFTLSVGHVYQLKITGPAGTVVNTGNGKVAIAIPRNARTGNDDFWFIVGISKGTTGIYVHEKSGGMFKTCDVKII